MSRKPFPGVKLSRVETTLNGIGDDFMLDAIILRQALNEEVVEALRQLRDYVIEKCDEPLVIAQIDAMISERL